MITKICIECNKEFSVNRSNAKFCSIECKSKGQSLKLSDEEISIRRKAYQQEYRTRNKEKIRSLLSIWRDNNKELKSAKDKEYRQKNKERKKQNDKEYANKNKDKIKDREKKRRETKEYKESRKKYLKEYLSIPIHKLRHNMASIIRQAIKNGGSIKDSTTINYLGCDIEFLKGWIESKFIGGMTWENYGSVWHIDHIRPCASFDLTNEQEKLECFNYKNLQPMIALDNIRKNSIYNGMKHKYKV